VGKCACYILDVRLGGGLPWAPDFGLVEASAVRAESSHGYSPCLWKARTFALGLSFVIILPYLIRLTLKEPNKQQLSKELLQEVSVLTVIRDVTVLVGRFM
jgi:hypothetical protein